MNEQPREWSDKRIDKYAIGKTADHVEQMQIYDGMVAIRDDLTQQLATLTAENKQLRQQRDSWQIGYGQASDERNEEREKWILAEQKLDALKAENERLRSGGYQPVDDGDINTWVSVEDNGKHIAVYVDDDRYAEETLPEGYALCRWQPGEPGQQAQLPDDVRATLKAALGIARSYIPVYGSALEIQRATQWLQDARPSEQETSNE